VGGAHSSWAGTSPLHFYLPPSRHHRPSHCSFPTAHSRSSLLHGVLAASGSLLQVSRIASRPQLLACVGGGWLSVFMIGLYVVRNALFVPVQFLPAILVGWGVDRDNTYKDSIEKASKESKVQCFSISSSQASLATNTSIERAEGAVLFPRQPPPPPATIVRD
jgi:hypothetical protein